MFTKSKKLMTSIVMMLVLPLAGCWEHGEEGKPEPIASSSTPSSDFLYMDGSTVPFSKLYDDVGKKNLDMTSFHISMTTKSRTNDQNKISITEADIDRTRPESVKMHIITSGDSPTEIISIGSDTYIKHNGAWEKTDGVIPEINLNTSASFFTDLKSKSDAVKKVTYVGHDDNGHHFVLLLDIDKLLGEENTYGTTNVDFWVDDALRMTRQVIVLKTSHGSSTLTTEQSKFGVPVNIVAPKK